MKSWISNKGFQVIFKAFKTYCVYALRDNVNIGTYFYKFSLHSSIEMNTITTVKFTHSQSELNRNVR